MDPFLFKKKEGWGRKRSGLEVGVRGGETKRSEVEVCVGESGVTKRCGLKVGVEGGE